MKFPDNKHIVFIGILFLFAFTCTSIAVQRGLGKEIDFAFTVKIQDAIDKSTMLRMKQCIGDVMEGSTFFASPGFSLVWIVGLTFFAVVDFNKKKIRWKGFIILLFFFLLTLAEIYGKSVVHHPAPPFFMIKNPTTIFPKYYINEQFSYPSGHAARAVFLSVCTVSLFVARFSILVRKSRSIILGLILLCYVGLVGISCIYLGQHWLSDIIGGMFLGAGVGSMVYIILNLDVSG